MKFKKIMSVIASAVMLSSTIGFAAAATFPAPFDSGSAIVYGAAGNTQMDMAAAINIQTAIGQLSGAAGADVPEGSWQVKTSSDKLEIGESLHNVETYIGNEDLPILASGEISNEKGTAKYDQYFYFDDVTSSSVTYQLNDDDDTVGLFYKVNSGQVIARYVMDFTTNLESDVAANVMDDIDDEEITLLGKTYTIITAVNSTATATDLTLMSGANKVTIGNGEELTVGGKTVSVLVSATNEARFTVDGETTSKLVKGETAKLSDGTYIGVSDITYQSFAGGLMQATAYIGADKIELNSGDAMIVNGETIGNAIVNISSTYAGGDVTIDTITINMTAEDDLFVPVGGKLSEAENLDEPQVLITQNWDIVFSGLEEETYETIELKKSTDSKIVLEFENLDGNKISLPVIYTNLTGVYGGDKAGYNLVLNASNNNLAETGNYSIAKNNYFILNTADPLTASNNAKSYVVQYKGSDKASDSNPKMKFNILGVDSDKEITMTTAGTADLKLGGVTFSFTNSSSCTTANDCNIYVSAGGVAATSYGAWSSNISMSNYLRTKNNILINITDGNVTTLGSNGPSADWTVSLYIDDTSRDGDNLDVTGRTKIFTMTYANGTDSEMHTTPSGGNYTTPGWVSNPDDNTVSTYIDYYGNDITLDNPSSAPDSVTIKVPNSIVEPLVYITSGSVTGGTTGGLALIVDDSQIDTVKSKNLVVVGGSCINTVAAKLLGSDVPLCTAEFTAKTGVGVGQYIIKTYANPYTAADSGKVAMLVAGYEAAETVSAGAKVAEKTVSSDVGTGNVYPIVSA